MRGTVAAIPLVLGIIGSTMLTDRSPVSLHVIYQGLPVNKSPEFPIKILDKRFYVIGYSEDFRNPAWVCYRIGAANDLTKHKRPTRFATDKETDARVSHDDYTNSGFDRGHMAPNFALGSRFGAIGAKSTFVMSNICPQFHDFNDGQWGDLEEWIAGKKMKDDEDFIKGWADEYGEVWVVVGPLLDEEREPLVSGVAVPNAFFCIVIDEDREKPRALAFIMEHEDQRTDELSGFLTSIDEIERRVGFDFFPDLPDAVEQKLESTSAKLLWPLPRPPN